MKIRVNSEEYECDKALKGRDSIKLVKNNKIFISFEGIRDFNDYEVIEGNWTDEISEAEIEKAQRTLETLALLEEIGVV